MAHCSVRVQRLSKPEALRARLRPGRAHAPEGGPLGRRLQWGCILKNPGFRPVGGSTPEGGV